MTEILKALDAITSRVLAYRPKDKGVGREENRASVEAPSEEGGSR